jgi:hypothetical protein
MAACLALCAAANGQTRPTRSDSNYPKRVDRSPFQRLHVDDLRVQLMALNDEACPLQLQSGRVAPAAGGHKALWVDVKSLSASGLASFSLTTIVFDSSRRLKLTRDTPSQVALAAQQSASVELTLDYSAMSSGDTLVVVVKRVALGDGDWQSDPQELLSVAKEFVRLQR